VSNRAEARAQSKLLCAKRPTPMRREGKGRKHALDRSPALQPRELLTASTGDTRMRIMA